MNTPNSKVTDGAIAGGIIAILVWLANDFAGVQIPAAAASGMTVLATFGLSYISPERRAR